MESMGVAATLESQGNDGGLSGLGASTSLSESRHRDGSCSQRIMESGSQSCIGRSCEAQESPGPAFYTCLDRCHGSFTFVKEKLKELAGRTGRAGDIRVWSRQDMGTSMLRTTAKGGPQWGQVLARATIEVETDRVLEQRLRSEMERHHEHEKLTSGVTHTTTFLLYVCDRWKPGILSGYETLKPTITTTVHY